jgi:hypothetical protein
LPQRQIRETSDFKSSGSRPSPRPTSLQQALLCDSPPRKELGDSCDRESEASNCETGSHFCSKGSLRAIPRIPLDLPSVQEERSLECTFQVTFLVPCGPEGRNFVENIRAAFREAPSTPLNGQSAGSCERSSDKSFVLVPYAGSRTALVLLQEIGPVQALEHVRLKSQSQSAGPSGSTESCFKVLPGHGWSAEGLPEPTNEMYARSTALVYVVHAAQCMDGMERQLGPICSVEAFYAAAGNDFLPNRSLAALQEASSTHEACASTPSVSARSHGSSDSGTEEILRQLAHRRVGKLPCNTVVMGDRESHRSLLMHVVTSLAASFCLSARDGDIPEPKKVVDFAESATVTPVTSLSRTSSPKTTPNSSMLSAAHESPGASASANAFGFGITPLVAGGSN